MANKLFPNSNCIRIALIFIAFQHFFVHSQLDSIHWIPPVTAADFGSNAGAYEHFVYLSTPETTPFDITVTTGTGTLVGTYSVSNSSPYRIDLANATNYLCLEADSVGSVQRDNGLVLSADQNFYANYRIRSSAQGGSLTAKGRIARGTNFYWGGMPNYGNASTMNAVMGIMAMEDGTTVTIDGYDPSCKFRLGSAADGITSNSITINLNEGESYVLEAVNLVVPENSAGWLGAHVSSNKDIVMNNGNLMGGVVVGNSNRDIGFDQTLPVERLGTQYITLKGNGLLDTELVIVIATEDGTTIQTNGGAIVAAINKGEYMVLDSSYYSPQNNMLIETNQPAYIYQVLAGSTNKRTIGLNFIPPLNCLLPLAVNNITDIDKIGATTYNGGVTVLTRSGASVLINGVPPISSPNLVTGTSDWVTYLESGLSGNISIESDEPMAAGMFGASGDAGFAGYFSGFSEKPTPEISANDNCVPVQLTLENTATNIQWFYAGSPIAGEINQEYTASDEGIYYAVAGTGTCFDTSNAITFTCNVLPIELTTFEHRCNQDQSTLYWHTASEYNNAYFTVWKTEDGNQFELFETIPAIGSLGTASDYEIKIPESNTPVYYQLSQTDIDGHTEAFETISTQSCYNDLGFYISDNYLHATEETKGSLCLYNALGSVVYQTDNFTCAQFLGGLPSGVYQICYQAPKIQAIRSKIVIR